MRTQRPGPMCVDPFLGRMQTAGRTPGSLGLNDYGDPNFRSEVGDTPSPIGLQDAADPNLIGSGEGNPALLAVPRSAAQESEEVLLIAGVAYGEASVNDVYEEIAGIASVIVRQIAARRTTAKKLLGPKSTFAFAASDGNPRAAAFRMASPEARRNHAGMAAALDAAQNALDGGKDHSEGGYFWDGLDVKTNHAKHPKVLRGIQFTDEKHNIYGIKETTSPVVVFWQVRDATGNLVNGRERGRYDHVYESTAAHGGTIFWKYSAAFLRATGNKEHL